MNQRAKAQQEQTAAAEAAKVWRQVRWILIGVFAALFVAVLFLTGVLPPREKLTTTDLAVFTKYDAIRHALANEQLDEARRAAGMLAAIEGAKPIYTEPAKTVAHSDSLAAAREHLVPLSEAIVALTRGRTGYLVMHCAMQGCPEPCENCPMEHYSRGFRPRARSRIPTWASSTSSAGSSRWINRRGKPKPSGTCDTPMRPHEIRTPSQGPNSFQSHRRTSHRIPLSYLK